MNIQMVLILHGWNLTASKFQPLIGELSDRGYQVHCPDLPGFGKTPLTANTMNLGDYVQFINDYLIKHNIKKVILIGHSFGGRVAIKFINKYQYKISALILTGTPGLSPVTKLKVVFF